MLVSRRHTCYGRAMASFAQITDLHLRPPGVATRGGVDCAWYTERAVDAVLSRHPEIDAVLVTGDVTDLGEDDGYALARSMLSRFEVPVLVVPGNHDRTARLRAGFAGWPGMGEEPVPGKVCHVHDIGDARVVMLDSSVDRLDDHRHYGALGEAQLEWLADVLNDPRPTLIGLHHPPFEIGIRFLDRIMLRDADALARVIAGRAHVRRIVCGHVHRPAFGVVAGVPAMTLPGVAHQIALTLDPQAAPKVLMEPPAYGLHVIGAEQDISHIGVVDAFPPPPEDGE